MSDQTTLETQTESCDGADLGTASCASLGFTGGTLGCTSLCSFNTNRCDSCVSDSRSLACRHTELLANSPSSLALTASGDEIAVAWVAGPGLLGNDPVAGSARLARFAPDLSLISQSDCFGPAHAHRVALARSRSGYIVAIDDDGDTGVSIQSFDAAGGALEWRRVFGGARIGGGALFVALDSTVTTPPISETAGEFPGLAWSGAGGALVSLGANWQRFDASGTAIGAAVTLPKSIFIPSAIAMQGSDSIVLFGTGTGTIDMDGEISVGRFAADGTTVTAPFRVIVDPEGLAEPRLASSRCARLARNVD